MSDATVKEAKRQEGLARSHKDYLIAVIFFIVGIAVIISGYNYGFSNGFLMFIGYLILGGPVFFGVFMSRKMSALLPWTDYEVITTYSDGSKESDHGAESSAIWLIGVLIGFVLGGPIALLRIVWLTIKTITYYVAVKEKPAFLVSPFPVLLLFLVGSVLGLVIPGSISKARANAISLDVPEIEQGTILTADRNSTKIYAEAAYVSTVVKELNKNDTVTVTGKIRERVFIPVDHNGTTGWVSSGSVRVEMPVIATAVVSVDTTAMRLYATEEKGSRILETLNKGDTVSIIGEEKNGFTPIDADVDVGGDGHGGRVFAIGRGFVKTEDITVQGGN